jgi:hypothetical protein
MAVDHLPATDGEAELSNGNRSSNRAARAGKSFRSQSG